MPLDRAKERELLDILQELSPALPQSVRTDVAELTGAGEWGLALEVLCEMVQEHDVVITAWLFRRIELLGRSMITDDSGWIALTSPVKGD